MRIFITGENSYISNKLFEFLNRGKIENNKIEVVKRSIRLDTLDEINLENFDVVIHLAAIVHRKESKVSEEEYFDVNTKLTNLLAQKSKAAGVKQFIFFSTMAVFGEINGEINKFSIPYPKSLYGKSKLLAEQNLLDLQNDCFIISIVRPPMIYGPKCPGNYSLLSKFAKRAFIFPDINNNRSMIYIGNLMEFINQLLIYKDAGVFHPQDKCFVNTSNMVKAIAESHDKKVKLSKLLSGPLRIILGNSGLYSKVFGSLYYSKELSTYRDNSYHVFDFHEAILKSEEE